MEQLEQQVQQLQAKLQESQSRSFELISQISAERDKLHNTGKNLEAIISQVVSILGMTNPTVDSIYSEVARIKADASKTKGKGKPSPKPKVKK